MSTKNTINYLNDHLAGSAAALDLVNHLSELTQGVEWREFFIRLHQEIKADQQILGDLLQGLAQEESETKKLVGWLAEKISRLKLECNGWEKTDLGLLEALEILALGIQGKRILWRALTAVSSTYPVWSGVDFTELEKRAQQQRDAVETRRLEVAALALSAGKEKKPSS